MNTVGCYKFAALGLSLALALHVPNSTAATFEVDTTSDMSLSACNGAIANDCSLRGALNAANATPVADDIVFNIPQADPGFQAATQHWRISVPDGAILPSLVAPVELMAPRSLGPARIATRLRKGA